MSEGNRKYSIEVCLTPKLFDEVMTEGEYLVVLADILRATTSICTAFHNGAAAVIPVSTLEEARRMKERGYLVASEQDGKKLDFADFGNSAFSFTRDRVSGKTIVYCTTNGTRALEVARNKAQVAIGAFINITALMKWLVRQERNIVILCSGWKNMFCLEDTLFAGALTELLIQENPFYPLCDAAHAALDLYATARPDMQGYLEKAMHRKRLRTLGLDDVIPYSLIGDQTTVVPVFSGTKITNMNQS